MILDVTRNVVLGMDVNKFLIAASLVARILEQFMQHNYVSKGLRPRILKCLPVFGVITLSLRAGNPCLRLSMLEHFNLQATKLFIVISATKGGWLPPTP